MPKNDRQTLEAIKFSLEVRERQNKFGTIKGVRRVPTGLSISPKRFRELFLQKSSNKASKSWRADCKPSSGEN